MRVVHLISNLGIGGAEMALCALVESSARYGIEHTVVSFLPNGTLRLRLEKAGANVVELQGRRGVRGVFLLRQLARALAGTEPDIVHAWMYHANIAASTIRRLGRISCPLIWSIRQSADDLALDGRFTQVLIRLGAAWSAGPDAIVYNSAIGATSHEAIGYAPGRHIVIPNGIDSERFRPRPEARAELRSELGLAPDALLVGRVARYSPMKDFVTLFQAHRLMFDRLPSARLVMAGDGICASNEELVALCQTHGSLEHTHFLGPRLDIEKLYPGLDVLVSSSVANEGFPNVVAEGLSSGIPVVATLSGDEQLVRGGVSVVVEPGDFESLAFGVISILSASQEFKDTIGQKSREFVRNNYSLNLMASRYRELYIRLKDAHKHD